MIVEGIITVGQLYELVKYWGPIVAFGVAVYKASSWVKDKGQAAEDIQSSVTTLDANVRAQTTQIVTELRELRSDIRTFYGPLALSVSDSNPKPARSRRKVVTKPIRDDMSSTRTLLLDN